jgi:beta-glucosidase
MSIKYVMLLFYCPLFFLFLQGCSSTGEKGPDKTEILQPVLRNESGQIIEIDGLRFKDLNKNGSLDQYEDWRLSPETRSKDLVSKMTLQEKSGAMMHGSAPTATSEIGTGSQYDLQAVQKQILEQYVTTMITRLSVTPEMMAAENNKLQRIAESGRLGIPLTISTDPRNHFQQSADSMHSTGFSQWPELTGFAALEDEALVRRFADIARQEYRAVGIQETLSPQADLATEPRWSRIPGTFGEDTELSRKLVKAYVEGFQNGKEGLNQDSVAAVVKHWAGYGAQEKGWDSHNYYGRYAVFPGNNFSYHITPFKGAFEAQVAGVMPTYSILKNLEINGKTVEQVGAGFNKLLLTDMLKKKYKFTGIVLSDWLITADLSDKAKNGAGQGEKPDVGAMCWGVETLSKTERYAKAINAGIDQFGGVTESEYITNAVKQGLVTESRIDESVGKILLQKFKLGLFENPYADEKKAAELAGDNQWKKEGIETQARSMVLLKNTNHILPLKKNAGKVFLYGIDAKIAEACGFTVTDTPESADFALIRTSAPYQNLHPNYFFGNMQHEGDLDFKEDNPDYKIIKKAAEKIPVIVTVYLDRPAILTNVAGQAAALLGNFGTSDEALFMALTGTVKPEGKLPFELPSSMQEVQMQKEDVAHDTLHPLYHIFYGLTY